MQFSDTTDKQGIIQDITFLLGVDVNQYKIEDRTRNINSRNAMIWTVIFEAYGGWKFHDSNADSLPYADQTLTSGTALYTLPEGALTVRFVEIKDTSGVYHRLNPLTEEEFKAMGADARWTSSGFPEYYLLYEDSIKLLQTPNFTVASTGLRIFFDAGMVDFTADDTTAVPGFASIFHRALSVGGALDYATVHMPSEAVNLERLWLWYVGDKDRNIVGAIARFYSKRFQDRFPHRVGPGEDLMSEFR